jgi:hypothetical protein
MYLYEKDNRQRDEMILALKRMPTPPKEYVVSSLTHTSLA